MDNKYDALKNTTNWIINASSEEFMSTFEMLGNNYSGMTIGEFIDSFIDNSDASFLEYDILTTSNFIFGAEEITLPDQNRWDTITEYDPLGSTSIGLIDVEDIKFNTEQKCTDLYDAANDYLYYSLAA